MIDLIVFFACLAIVILAWWFLVGKGERRILAEMSDACISANAMWENDGQPMNIYAEEFDRRKKLAKEQPCKT